MRRALSFSTLALTLFPSVHVALCESPWLESGSGRVCRDSGVRSACDSRARLSSLLPPSLCTAAPDRAPAPRSEVAQLAALHGVLLRTGTLCNPGAAALHLGFSAAQLAAAAAAGGGCGSGADLIEGVTPAGAVRVSFGWASAWEDAEAVARFVAGCFAEPLPGAGPTAGPAHGRRRASAAALPPGAPAVALARAPAGGAGAGREVKGASAAAAGAWRSGDAGSGPGATPGLAKPEAKEAGCQSPLAGGRRSSAAAAAARGGRGAGARSQSDQGAAEPAAAVCVPDANGWAADSSAGARLTGIYLYPIKSCAAFTVRAWPLGANGLLLDREWALVGADGAALTLRQAPALAAVRPAIDLAAGAASGLHVDMRHHDNIRIP